MRSGSDTEMTSGFSGEQARLITEARASSAARTACTPRRAVRDHRGSAEAQRHRRQRAAPGLTPIASACGRSSASAKAGCSRPALGDRGRPRRLAPVQRRVGRIDGASRARCRGKSWASSTPAAASPSRSCGATPKSCRAPISAATRISRSTPPRNASTASRAQGCADHRAAARTSSSCASRNTTRSSPRCCRRSSARSASASQC